MKNILFIDDDYNRSSSLYEMLRIEGYNIKVATAAKEALEEFIKNKDNYDIIILDVMMPSGDFMTKEETKSANPPSREIFSKTCFEPGAITKLTLG